MRIVRTFTLKNKLGLHARAAGMVVKISKQYIAKISLERDGIVADGRSILGILTLACPQGEAITVTAEGADAANVMEALEKLIEDKFGEE